jgi:hypothetical protein
MWKWKPAIENRWLTLTVHAVFVGWTTFAHPDEPQTVPRVPRILPQELEKHANSELVSVVIPLTSIPAEDAASEVKKMLGPFGTVVPLLRANQLLLQDTVGNLKRISQTLSAIDVPAKRHVLGDPPILKSYSVPAGYAPAVARVLQEIYKTSSRIRLTPVGDHSILVFGSPDSQQEIARQILNLRESGPSSSANAPEGPRRTGSQPQASAGSAAPQRGELFDIYLKGARIAEDSPSIVGLRFDGYETVAGLRLLRFHKEISSAEVYFIQPAEVAAFRLGVPSRAPRDLPAIGISSPGVFRGFAGSGAGNPIIERLDAIMAEIKKLELKQADKGNPQTEGPRDR